MAQNKWSGTTDPMITEREVLNGALSREAAEAGIVLLKNDGVLPLASGSRIALLGAGAAKTVKGGTGSGDVNEREVVTIRKGLEYAGFELTSKDWLDDYEARYDKSRTDWRDMILDQAKNADGLHFFDVYSRNPYRMPDGRPIDASDIDHAEMAVYVVSRIAGEGADRRAEKGDYYLTDREVADLEKLNELRTQIVLIINAGGQVDLAAVRDLPCLKAILYVAQMGQEGGNALAAILKGDVTPSGKLTATWAKNFEDFPSSATFSLQDGNVDTEKYTEGIYVGYRYFDTWGVEPEFGFGYGLSYTTFEISEFRVSSDEDDVTFTAKVTNTGDRYSGAEVVQIYASCPQSGFAKEYRRLVGFAKTRVLLPGQSQVVVIMADSKNFASFNEKEGTWVLQAGQYGLWIGSSLEASVLGGVLEVGKDTVLETVSPICPLQEELTEIEAPESLLKREQGWQQIAKTLQIPHYTFVPASLENIGREEDTADVRARAIADQIPVDEIIPLLAGAFSKDASALGSAGRSVPGAAGETTETLEEKYGIPSIVMADGPAGVRVRKNYEVNPETGELYPIGMLDSMEGGLFSKAEEHPGADVYYQYCTAFPVGALLAQTWDPDIVRRVGRAVSVEMEELGISWWLAPGMNIYRNPLCGRNFEYYSEDPLIAGTIAAAITEGVQQNPHTGTTIKHFACNNQEEHRMGADSVVSERALREIYLRGFEIAVRKAQPYAIMTSYNRINGVFSANNKDLCTEIARTEWGFKGLIMTDWTTTAPHGGATAWKCPAAGNDLIMPGMQGDITGITKAYQDGRLSIEEIRGCAARILAGMIRMGKLS